MQNRSLHNDDIQGCNLDFQVVGYFDFESSPLPTFSLLALFLLLAAPRDSSGAAAGIHEIPMTAKKYEFSPSSIHVKKGEHVRLLITAADHDHGFKLPAFDIQQELKKGETTTVEFTADKAGTFHFACSRLRPSRNEGRTRRRGIARMH
jgi:plastocyanin